MPWTGLIIHIVTCGHDQCLRQDLLVMLLLGGMTSVLDRTY